MPETPIREAAFAALAAAIDAAALTCAGAAVTVERNRAADVAPEACPLLVLMDGGHVVLEDSAAGITMYRVSCQLAGYIAAETEAEQSARVAELHAKAVRAMAWANGATERYPVTFGGQEIWPMESALRTDPASVADSEAPNATFVIDIVFDLTVEDGNPFITL